MQRLIVLLAIVTAFASNALQAAELRLRQQCSPRGSVVTLGDVADIFSADAKHVEKLAAVELFPAPSTAQTRVLRVRELQDILILRGVNLAENQFSGSSQVVLASAVESTQGDQLLTATAQKRIQRRVQEALLQYIQSKTNSDEQCIVQFELTPALARAVSNPAQSISISGGTAPWTGSQRFEVSVDSAENPARVAVDVKVVAPTLIVAAVHALSRGAVIRETDLTLIREVPRDGESSVFHGIEEVVGKQTTRAVSNGKIIATDDLQSPSMVRRGDVVTVYARSAGIQVRTTARAKDDGGLGDLVTMETMHDRKTYQARVCGIREAEIFAQAVSTVERK